MALAALLVYVPVFQDLLGTAALPASDLAILLPMPFVVWGPTSCAAGTCGGGLGAGTS